MLGCFLQVIVHHANGADVAHVAECADEAAPSAWCDPGGRFFGVTIVRQARIMPIPVEVQQALEPGHVVRQALEPGALLADGRYVTLCTDCRKAAKL